jgi:hypothetical protein
MKICLSVFLIYFTSSFLSQTIKCDKIVCISGEEIEGIVSEITPEFISYKKCDYIDGPKYTIEKSKVFIIKYKNGSKDVINDLAEPISSTFKKEKEKVAHGKLYYGFELHYDQAIKNENYNVNNYIENTSHNYSHLSNIEYNSFLFNYKANKIYEIDLSVGVGFARLNYYSSIKNGVSQNDTRLTINQYYSSNNFKAMAVLNIGSRINYLNLFNSQERKINPFIKPEISIMKTFNKSFVTSYSANLGVNFNKRISISIGYKYIPLKTTTEEYIYKTHSTKISNSVIGFHNLLGNVSFEF